ncbi:MAG: DUF1616 domain-containing protein [Nitrososphaerales archaeon]
MSAKTNSAEIRKLGIDKLALEKCSSEKIELWRLVKELQAELEYPEDRIIGSIMELSETGKVRLAEKRPYRKLVSYALSPASLLYWAAILSTLLSLGLIFVTSGAALYLRYVFGGLLVLFLPGYSLLELLYAKKKELDNLTRVALSIGLSLALVPLTGLVLNYTPFGIRLIPVAISLTLLTIIFLTLGLWRKHAYYKLANDVM